MEHKQFADKYNAAYRELYNFHEKYAAADSDADLEHLVAELPGLSRTSPFMADLLVAITAEIERVYESRKQPDFDSIET